MPLYTYQCRKCESTFKEARPIADRKIPTESPCPECGEMDLYIQIQPTKMSYQGNMKTSNNFNDRLKAIKKNIPESARGSIDANIR